MILIKRIKLITKNNMTSDLDLIWSKQFPNEDSFVIKDKIQKLEQFECYIATNHKLGRRLFIIGLSSETKIPEYKRNKFQGVRIEVFELDETQKEINIFLLEDDLKDIFTLFIENIIDDLHGLVTEKEAVLSILNCVEKWRRIFGFYKPDGLTKEQQKGLIGELLFIKHLLDEKKTSVTQILNSWTGPDLEAKDFNFPNVNAEVKFTTSTLPRIKISSERQLENIDGLTLYLLNIIASDSKSEGISLNSLIEEIRNVISESLSDLKLFNEKLEKLKYFDIDKENYNSNYNIKSFSFYEVDEQFPKIIPSEIPKGIHNTSYYVELSAIEKNKINNDTVIKLFTE